jgi:hypothetical protein
VSGGVPDQEPVDALSACPAVGVPVIVGGAVFAGGAAPTTAVACDVADDESAFDAVTTTRRVEPTSPELTAYAAVVAPRMFVQLLPPASQRRHWYAYEIGCVPVHAPGSAVSVFPSCAMPVIVGGDVFDGCTSFVVTTTS